MPFRYFARRLPHNPSSSHIHTTYKSLLQFAKEAVNTFISALPEELTVHPDVAGNIPISYNLAMTTSGIALVPRRREGCMLRRDDGTNIGYIQLNGTVLGGTLMVKFQEEWDVLRARPDKLDAILEAIGIPLVTQTKKL